MCLEAKDPQQDRGGDCNVYVRDDGLSNLLSLLSAKISCAAHNATVHGTGGGGMEETGGRSSATEGGQRPDAHRRSQAAHYIRLSLPPGGSGLTRIGDP